MTKGRVLKIKLTGVIIFLAIAVYTVISYDFSLADSPEIKAEEKPGGYDDFFRTITVPIGQTTSGYAPGYRYTEMQSLKKRRSVLKSSFSDTLVWQQRGPYNVAGRTRSILVDPDDTSNNTWYAGTAGGGIWKTTDGGSSWVDLTPELPNLSTVALCMAPGNHDIIFAGTGEGFGGVGMITGDGLFKSNDRGASWSRVESTRNPDFFYINDIWISPDDEDLLLLATNRGLYRTINGGMSWDTVYRSGYRVQDLEQNPLNPSTIYAGVNTIGVIRSYDMGLTWNVISEGMRDMRRVAVAASKVDTSYLFASVQKRQGDMAVYISTNSGDSWLPNGKDELFFNFHGAQGWYNNTIAADPFIKEKVYVGGVYIGAITFTSSSGDSDPEILSADSVNTSSFLDFINFGGSYFGGGMSTGIEEEADVTEEDFVSVEIRFGPGMKQKAHRFQVPEGEGPGVPKEDYTYYDYVDVPFEVWDMTNDRQLMVSFRDQERDGTFNLIKRSPDDEIPGREYIFVNAVEYDPDNPAPSIAKAGGHFEKMMYFFWPTLADGGTWDAEALPESKISIEYGSYPVQFASTEVLSSNAKNTNLHVDHHQLLVIPGASSVEDRVILSANDGGVGISKNSGSTWKQLAKGLYTTQFYGIAKKPGEDVFIGGMQDNGTWRSPSNETATEKSNYTNMLGGDGFEAIWHPTKENYIVGSIYNNRFYRSIDGGQSWQAVDQGIGESGPFISKLSHARSEPDRVYTIDENGVYIHSSFCHPLVGWELTSIPEGEGLDYYGSATSSIDVEVSEADPSVVWAGQGMYDEPVLNIFISKDHGETFNPVNRYDEVELGFISAIEPHPLDPNTAYLLFSYQGKPKILRTEDQGQSWEDISGFGTDSVSSNGFPDVVVLSLLVMPHDPDVIWAGTEIGIVESVDNGMSWHLLESDFPNVTVYQMFYQDKQIVLGTHGRGIWTASNRIVGVKENKKSGGNVKIYPNPATSELFVDLPDLARGKVVFSFLSTNGQVVRREEEQVSGSRQEFHFNIDDLEKGNYLLEIRNEGRLITRMFVVH